MPIFLEPRDALNDLKGFASVLIVSCPICPPMSVSIQSKRPLLEPFRHGIKTGAFEDYIQSIRQALEARGIRTGAFTLRLPVPMMCLWTGGQRRRQKDPPDRVENATLLDALRGTDCHVIQGMSVKTITNATATVRFPGIVDLDWHPIPEKPGIGQFGARNSREGKSE